MSTKTVKEIDALKLIIVNSIIEDFKWMMITGQIPISKINTFGDLHNYCDANCLGQTEDLFNDEYGLCYPKGHKTGKVTDEFCMSEEGQDLFNDIQDTVDCYIKSITFDMWRKRMLKREEVK